VTEEAFVMLSPAATPSRDHPREVPMVTVAPELMDTVHVLFAVKIKQLPI
jgi:hypothetical protein